MKDPASASMSRGVITVASSVEQLVSNTESATSPPATCVTTLEAAPPGQQANRISPAAIGPDISDTFATRNLQWAANPADSVYIQ
jgi:hypothetical protein